MARQQWQDWQLHKAQEIEVPTHALVSQPAFSVRSRGAEKVRKNAAWTSTRDSGCMVTHAQARAKGAGATAYALDEMNDPRMEGKPAAFDSEQHMQGVALASAHVQHSKWVGWAHGCA